MVRCFLAINLSPDARRLIQASMPAWRGLGKGVKWVKATNMHLTLKFLGNLDPGHVAEVSRCMDLVCGARAPFRLGLGQAGVFPSPKRPRILWIGLRDETLALERLKASLEQVLQEHGFAKDEKPFVPHVTVGRIKRRPPAPERLSHFLQTDLGQADTTVDRLFFYKSTLTPAGPIYEAISIHPFGGNASL